MSKKIEHYGYQVGPANIGKISWRWLVIGFTSLSIMVLSMHTV